MTTFISNGGDDETLDGLHLPSLCLCRVMKPSKGNCLSFSISEPNVYIYFTASNGNSPTEGIDTPPEKNQEDQNVGKQMYTVTFDSVKIAFDTLEDLVEYNNECNISQLVVVNEDVSVMYANGTHTTRIGPSRNAWSCQLTNRCM